MKHVEIYGQRGCKYCVQAVRHLEAHNIPVVYRDIDSSALDRAEMFRRNPDAKTVPQIFVGDRRIGGHDELVAIPLPQLQQMTGE